MSKREVVAAALSAAVLSSVFGASPAMADVGTYVPGGLTSAPTPGGMSPMTPYQGKFTCNGSWDPVSNTPSGYVIGSCPGATNFLRTDRSFADGAYYDGGFVEDSAFNACGWINSGLNTETDPNYQAGGCLPGNISRPAQDFMWVANCQPGACTDGTGVTVRPGTSCLEVANVRPFGATLQVTGAIRSVPAGYGYLKWRYIVGQNHAAKADSSGNYWVMVHDSLYSAGQGNWVFVPTSCLPYSLPAQPGSSLYYP